MSVPIIKTEYLDPIWVTTGGIFDCKVQFALGKQVVLCSNPDQEMQLTNPPDSNSQLKEIWIKNMLTVPLNVTSYIPFINNDHVLVLNGSSSGFDGECVHIIWSITLGRWIVLGKI